MSDDPKTSTMLAQALADLTVRVEQLEHHAPRTPDGSDLLAQRGSHAMRAELAAVAAEVAANFEANEQRLAERNRQKARAQAEHNDQIRKAIAAHISHLPDRQRAHAETQHLAAARPHDLKADPSRATEDVRERWPVHGCCYWCCSESNHGHTADPNAYPGPGRGPLIIGR